jgi:hypothetical protein
MFNICVYNVPVISSKDYSRLNLFLSDIEVEKDGKIYLVNTLEEYLNIFNIGLQKNNLGVYHLFYKGNEESMSNYRDCFEPILKYFKDKVYLNFSNNIKFSIRKNKLVRVY